MPLLLLHSGGQTKSTWDTIAPAFAATHHVFAIDLEAVLRSHRGGLR